MPAAIDQTYVAPLVTGTLALNVLFAQVFVGAVIVAGGAAHEPAVSVTFLFVVSSRYENDPPE